MITPQDSDTSLEQDATADPLSLKDQCLLHMICHLEDYSPDALALLPTRHRRTLLQNLPVVDICRLEGTAVTGGIDMSDVWQSVWHDRYGVNHSCSLFTAEGDNSDEEYRELYFQHITSTLFNKAGRVDNARLAFNFREVYDMLFGVPSCLGIDRWMKQEHPLSTYSSSVTTPRHKAFKDLLDDGYSTTEAALMKAVIQLCYYYPSRVSINCKWYTQTDLWQTNQPKLQRLLKTFLSKVEHIEFYCYDFQGHEVPRFFLKSIFSSRQRWLKSISMSGNVPFVMKVVQDVAGFCSPLETRHRDGTHPCYTGLESLEIKIRKHGCSTLWELNRNEPHLHLGAILQHQIALTEVTLGGWSPAASALPEYVSLISTASSLFQQPQFCKLMLFDAELSPSVLLALLPTFLNAPCTRRQVLVLKNVIIQEAMKPLPGGLEVVPNPVPGAVVHKELHFMEVCFDRAASKAWLSNYPLHLNTLSICSCFHLHVKSEGTKFFSYHPDLQVRNLILQGCLFSREDAHRELSYVLQCPTLKTLQLQQCKIAMGDLLPALTQYFHSHCRNLEDLHLGNNELGNFPLYKLQTLFDAVCKLPSLPSFSLNLDKNGLGSSHVKALCDSWKRCAQSRRMKRLSMAKNHLEESTLELGKIAVEVVLT